MADLRLDRDYPVDFTSEEYEPIFRRLQGNIVKGHGRDFTVSIFLQFNVKGAELRTELKRLAETYVTSAYDQLIENDQYQRFRVPGALFGNLFLTRLAYVELGMGERLNEWFPDPPHPGGQGPETSTFLNGMRAAAPELKDVIESPAEPLEKAYASGAIHAMLLLADDSEAFLLRQARAEMTRLERSKMANVLAVEIGRALRNDEDEGIEHFGYVDGRSQPLFLASDFRGLIGGRLVAGKTSEKVNDKARRRETGDIDHWNPFAPLSLALLRDPAVEDANAFGSYYVFRKLEQDVLRFSIAEQQLADALGLEGAARERAGAMIVGRFRDGTPLVLSETDGFIPAKANNFRYDGIDASGKKAPGAPLDAFGLKCPFQAHIRKVNPRQNVNGPDDDEQAVIDGMNSDRSHRIVRRGITYGLRTTRPDAFQALADLPTGGVGLLFACFQSSIIKQFAFVQKRWANAVLFKIKGDNHNQTGIDGIIGQRRSPLPQHWRKEYGGTIDPTPGSLDDLHLAVSHPQAGAIGGYVRFRGGEFFFAPSLTFLLKNE